MDTNEHGYITLLLSEKAISLFNVLDVMSYPKDTWFCPHNTERVASNPRTLALKSDAPPTGPPSAAHWIEV